MIAINSKVTDPYLNHAIEEAVIENYSDECFLLWKNDPCILLGKNQNAYSEINTEYVRENNIAVVRRPTGGGTVYNDRGNLNFSFIASRADAEFADFKRFTKPVVDALKKLSVPAEYKGRNDLLIDGKKFSGNAQCWMKDKVLHHGTILFDSDLDALSNALNVNKLKLLSKGIHSAKSRVANISDYLKVKMDIYQFKDYLFNEIKESLNAAEIELTAADLQRARQIAEGKYRLHSWNYGERSTFNIRREQKFAAGLVSAEIQVNDGIISGISFFGDYFSTAEDADFVSAFKGRSYDFDTVTEIVGGFDIPSLFNGIDAKEIVTLII